MNIHLVTDNHYLHLGLKMALFLHSGYDLHHYTLNCGIFLDVARDSRQEDVFIISPEHDCLDFSWLIELNKSHAGVIIATNHSEWKLGNIFKHSVIPQRFLLSDLLQCIYLAKHFKQESFKLPKITRMEKSVLRLVMTGMSISCIGSTLNITTKTAYTHQRNALKKIGIRKSTDLLKLPHHYISYLCK